uniref:Uncharacterized protein n=1 Tax=Staphylothermus marinus TaxID=2280 RepID=A0A7J3PK31_STAMA
MSKVSKRSMKAVSMLIESRKPYYLVRFYESGDLTGVLKKVLKPEFIKRWLLYNQSLLEYGYVKVFEKRGGRTITVVFDEFSMRHFKLYTLYLHSIVNLKSNRRVDCLAKCFSNIDATSPVIDLLLDLSRIIDRKKFIGLLRGFCLCQ